MESSLFLEFILPFHLKSVFLQRKNSLKSVVFDLYNHLKSVNWHVVQKDYIVHSALNNLLKNPDYNIQTATVISNEREIHQDGKITYMPSI